jgi:hypothetical protein
MYNPAITARYFGRAKLATRVCPPKTLSYMGMQLIRISGLFVGINVSLLRSKFSGSGAYQKLYRLAAALFSK